MGFRHIQVSDAEGRMEKVRTSHAERFTTLDDESALTSQATQVDGVWVHNAFAKFCEAVRVVYPTIKFGAKPKCNSEWVGGLPLPEELCMYFPGDIYVPMVLEYKDKVVRQYSTEVVPKVFVVSSRIVANNKYREYSDKYYTRQADTMDRAVSAVKKNLRRYTPMEVAGLTIDDVRRYTTSSTSAAQSDMYSLERTLTRGNELPKNLKYLSMQGVRFADLEFQSNVDKIVQAYDKYMEEKDRAHHGWHVSIRQFHDEQMFEVVRVTDIGNLDSKQVLPEAKAYTLPELPEDIAHKIAALTMLENDKHVEGLGVRVSAYEYWVFE